MKHYLLWVLFFATPLFAEGLPDAPGVVDPGPSRQALIEVAAPAVNNQFLNPHAPQEHRFFNRGNELRFAALAGLVAADGATTQMALKNGSNLREVDPLARPFVNHGDAGQAAASVVGLGFAIGTSYLFHRTGHHRLERMMLDASIAAEAEVVTSNSWYLAH